MAPGWFYPYYSHMHTRSHTYMLTCMRYSRAHTHTRTHAHTHIYGHTHTRVHSHTKNLLSHAHTVQTGMHTWVCLIRFPDPPLPHRKAGRAEGGPQGKE